ncbi:MAG: DUF692 family protein [Chloroflexi bacterium]|nr:DUF692 family protein [Chloroflexota bacterium]
MAAEGSPALIDLVRADRRWVDYVQVGPWLGPARMQVLAEAYPVLLHSNAGLVSRRLPFSALSRWAKETGTPWLSLHLGLDDTQLNRLWKRFGLPLPRIGRHLGLTLAIENLLAFQQMVEVPVAIENQAHHRPSGHDYVVDPAFICDVIAATDSRLLLDLGHARVSAAMRGMPVTAYISKLPLAHVVELHVSGPGEYRGRLRDLHRPLSEADYDLVSEVVARCPQLRAITLEYFGPVATTRTQLQRLRTLLDTLTR